MSGFMADFEADLAMPFGLARTQSGPGQIVFEVLYFLGSGGTLIVPAGATLCDAEAIGAGGGGGGSSGTAQGGSAGGGAMGRSRFAVKAGSVISYVSGQAGVAGNNSGTDGTDGVVSTVTYGGVIVAQGDGGRGGKSTTTSANGADGLGGQPANCIGNVEVRAGQPGSQATYGGGACAPNAYGVSPLTSGNAPPAASGSIGASAYFRPPGVTTGSVGAAGGSGGNGPGTGGGYGSNGYVKLTFYAG